MYLYKIILSSEKRNLNYYSESFILVEVETENSLLLWYDVL
jgi:hypothetical protein